MLLFLNKKHKNLNWIIKFSFAKWIIRNFYPTLNNILMFPHTHFAHTLPKKYTTQLVIYPFYNYILIIMFLNGILCVHYFISSNIVWSISDFTKLTINVLWFYYVKISFNMKKMWYFQNVDYFTKKRVYINYSKLIVSY